MPRSQDRGLVNKNRYTGNGFRIYLYEDLRDDPGLDRLPLSHASRELNVITTRSGYVTTEGGCIQFQPDSGTEGAFHLGFRNVEKITDGDDQVLWENWYRSASDYEDFDSSLPRVFCRDCLCRRGEEHAPGCDVEECPFCHGQIISCGCAYEQLGIDSNSEPVYSKGLNEEQQERWGAIVEQKGAIPYGSETREQF